MSIHNMGSVPKKVQATVVSQIPSVVYWLKPIPKQSSVVDTLCPFRLGGLYWLAVLCSLLACLRVYRTTEP